MGDVVGEGSGTAGSGLTIESYASTADSIIAEHNQRWSDFLTSDDLGRVSDEKIRATKLDLIVRAADLIMTNVGVSKTTFQTETPGRRLDTIVDRLISSNETLRRTRLSNPIKLAKTSAEGPEGPITVWHHVKLEERAVGKPEKSWGSLVLGRMSIVRQDWSRDPLDNGYAIRHFLGSSNGQYLVPVVRGVEPVFIPAKGDCSHEQLDVMQASINEIATAAGCVLKLPVVA